MTRNKLIRVLNEYDCSELIWVATGIKGMDHYPDGGKGPVLELAASKFNDLEDLTPQMVRCYMNVLRGSPPIHGEIEPDDDLENVW